MKRQVLILTLLLISASIYAQVIHVPGDQPTIQAGIDEASNGDTVLVAENTYYENIRFMGKAITVASHYVMDGDTNHINNTVIDGSQPAYPDSAACVMFVHGEDTTSILNGFTLTGGSGVWTVGFKVRSGGGVYAWESGAKIMNNKIMYNQVESDSGGGAGLQFLGGDTYWAVIANNTVSHNTSISDGYSAFGAGMSILVNAVIKNNIIEHNSCVNTEGMADGCGIELEIWEPQSNQYAYILNNIIRYNTLEANTYSMGAGFMTMGVPCEIKNNEVYNNESLAVDRCFGGGLRIVMTRKKVLIHGNDIYNNTQDGEYGQGGGIDIGLAKDTVVISENTIWGNDISASNAAWGSGINCVQDSFLLITDNHIYENHIAGSNWWCGAGMWHEDTYGTLEITGNNINRNTGTGTSYGGGFGFYDTEGATYIVNSNLIQENQCNYGAGLWTYNTYDIDMTNNIFSENQAWAWGGAYALRHATDDKSKEISIAHSMGEDVTFNLPKQELHPAVVNNTFYANTAGSTGGAIDSDQRDHVPIFFNNIFWENTAPEGENIYLFVPDTIYLSYCDINTDENSISGNWTGMHNFFEDPEFEAGDSLCHIHGGPCHDEGTDHLKVNGIVYPAPDIDFEGTPRPQGDLWDVGADECLMESVWMPRQDESFKLIASPNPCSGAAKIQYSTYSIQYTKVELYSADGVKVKILFAGTQQAGEHEMNIDLIDLPDGLYFIRLQAGKEVETAKLILIK